MIKKSINELQENYRSIEKLCLASTAPIIFCSSWQNRIALMNQNVYEALVQDYDISKYGIRLKRRDVTDYREKVFIYCTETGEPVFIPTKSGKDIVFMDIILYNYLSMLWQIHPFSEGNTRTTAVFFIKYLRTLGFDVTNDVFAEHAWYFRNSLVGANYSNPKSRINETTEYLEFFLRNLLLNEHHPLHNQLLRISDA